MPGLDQFVDQRRRGRESHPAFLATGRHRQAREQVGFAGPAVTYKDDGLSPPDVAARGQLMNLLHRDIGALGEIELMLSST